MSVRKIAGSLLTINILQFIISFTIWVDVGNSIPGRLNVYILLSMGLMLFSSLITILGFYFASRYKNVNMEESIRNLEALNTTLRTQRHDYLNHFQVIYGLMELEEYEEAKRYLEPVFKDIMKVSKALRTSQPAVNALLQAKLEMAEKNQIDLFLEVRSDLKNIPIEPWNLCKVLANIIDNAITALSETTTEKSIDIEIGETRDSYTFLIDNNGPVIPENKIGEIFKQGYTTKKGQEHGMGLYIASKIVKDAEGRIEVSSTEAKTSFFIEIPKK